MTGRQFDWQGTYLSNNYVGYRDDAESRGYTWDISKSEFLVFALGDCHYCGAEPKPVIHTRIKKRKESKKRKAHTNIARRATGYSGLDRIDNSKGYYADNVVSCCRLCNSGKHEGTMEEYIERCIRVAAIHRQHLLFNRRTQ